MGRGYYEVQNVVFCIDSVDNSITRVSIVNNVGEVVPCPIIDTFITQLDEYFKLQRTSFDISYTLSQLPFRTKLYNRIINIPYGETFSNKNLLSYMGLSKGVSVIARATYNNPLLLIIPCHRTVNPLRRVCAYKYPNDFREYLLKLEGGLINGSN